MIVGMCATGGDGLGRRGLAENEKFDKHADEDHDGDLAEEEADGEGISVYDW